MTNKTQKPAEQADPMEGKEKLVKECPICKGTLRVADMDGVLTDFPCVCQVFPEIECKLDPYCKCEDCQNYNGGLPIDRL